ncbi:hypothetical protein BD414DRAFT_510288 [Trametes punicea]|nr:hypothetical protein BD414DRAFT_510288 [Trametes punicea]
MRRHAGGTVEHGQRMTMQLPPSCVSIRMTSTLRIYEPPEGSSDIISLPHVRSSAPDFDSIYAKISLVNIMGASMNMLRVERGTVPRLSRSTGDVYRDPSRLRQYSGMGETGLHQQYMGMSMTNVEKHGLAVNVRPLNRVANQRRSLRLHS